MMAERLHLWRLKNFNVERLPSVEDVYLLHAVANDNPKDERLFAVAEVRDLTPVRDQRRPHRATAASGAHVRGGDGGHAQFQCSAARTSGSTGTASSFMCGRTLSLKPDEVNDIVHQPGTDRRLAGPGAGGGPRPHSQSPTPASCATR